MVGGAWNERRGEREHAGREDPDICTEGAEQHEQREKGPNTKPFTAAPQPEWQDPQAQRDYEESYGRGEGRERSDRGA